MFEFSLHLCVRFFVWKSKKSCFHRLQRVNKMSEKQLLQHNKLTFSRPFFFECSTRWIWRGMNLLKILNTAGMACKLQFNNSTRETMEWIGERMFVDSWTSFVFNETPAWKEFLLINMNSNWKSFDYSDDDVWQVWLGTEMTSKDFQSYLFIQRLCQRVTSSRWVSSFLLLFFKSKHRSYEMHSNEKLLFRRE